MRFAGERMKKITLKKPVTQRDSVGQVVTTYVDADNDPNLWADVRDSRGNEGYDSDKKTATLQRVFQIHWREDINEQWIIVEDGRQFDIRAIHPIGRRKLDIESEWTQGKYDE